MRLENEIKLVKEELLSLQEKLEKGDYKFNRQRRELKWGKEELDNDLKLMKEEEMLELVKDIPKQALEKSKELLRGINGPDHKDIKIEYHEVIYGGHTYGVVTSPCLR